MPQSNSRTRRTSQQWQQLIDQWSSSGLSAAKFCARHQIVYSTFQAWRHRLKEQSDVVIENVSMESNFIDLTQLPSAQPRPWCITLRLGNGVELELSQAR